MPTAHEIVDLLGRHASPHFVVDIKAAKEEMENPLRDFKTVLSDQTVSQWHFYALEGLRSIAAESSISPEDGQIIIESTKWAAQQFGIDEFYKTFDALSRSPSNARLLARFVGDLLHSRDQRDWLWLAFSGMATLLERQPDVVTTELANELLRVYQQQRPAPRGPQMEEIIRKITRPQVR